MSMHIESWDKEKVMSLNNDDLLLYINSMLAKGWSLGRLNEEKGIRRQTVRDRLKKDGYVFDRGVNAFVKATTEHAEPQKAPEKVSEKAPKVQKQMSDEVILESLQNRIEALEKAVNAIQTNSDTIASGFELVKFDSKEQPRNYPLYQEVIDLLTEVHSSNKHLKVKDIVNHALYYGLNQMKHRKNID